MAREYKKSDKLRSFKIDLDGLERLLEVMKVQFQDLPKLWVKITIDLPGQSIESHNFADIRALNDLTGTTQEFTIRVAELASEASARQSRSITLRSSQFGTTLSVDGAEEKWVKNSFETVANTLTYRRELISDLKRLPLGFIGFSIFALGFATLYVLKKGYGIDLIDSFAHVATLSSSLFLLGFILHLIPDNAELSLSETQPWWRARATELSLLLGVLSLLLSVAALF